jgi:subfamily B ATP-binding cassette protein MsbA
MEQSNWRAIWNIFRFARPHVWLIVLAFGAIAGYAAAEGAYLVLMKPFLEAFVKFLDAGAKGTANATQLDMEALRRIGWYALALAPVTAALAFLEHYLADRLRTLLTVDLRNAVCRAILPQSLTFFEGRRSGDLMSRITNDVTRAQMAFQMIFSGIPQHLAHLAMGVAVAAWMSWQMLIIGAVAVPVIVFPLGYLARRIRRYGRQGLEKLADITDLMAQMFSGIRIIKAFKMEDAEAQEFERHNWKYFSKMMKMVTARGMSHGVVELIIRSFIAGAVFLGLWLVGSGRFQLQFANLVLAIGGMYYAFNATRKLVKCYNELQESMPATERVLEMLDQRPALQDAADAVPMHSIERGIVFRDVTFGYDAEVVLRDISFEARRGETIAIVGRSGAGKSTLTALLPRFYDVTAGVIEIDGVDVRRIRRESLLDRIAIVSQQTFLFNRSIADNIRYGRRDATQEEVEEAARMAHIHEFVLTQEGGYGMLCGEFGAKLSGGQRQRIAIARAMLKNADILILDEAMTGLDAESETLVREALEALMRGRTTFVVTHDLTTIRSADRILVLKDGRLVGNGRHDELIAQEGEYRNLCAFQG